MYIKDTKSLSRKLCQNKAIPIFDKRDLWGQISEVQTQVDWIQNVENIIENREEGKITGRILQ